jgi:hypothetical protein
MIRADFPRRSLRSLPAMLLVAACVNAQNTVVDAAKEQPAAVATPVATNSGPALEPKAIEILKATSDRLAAALSMSFTADVSYESPTRQGPPLVYATQSDVTLVRPDKLRVITPGDGPASEFYYDGKTMMAYVPGENLLAMADAPPTIDATLEAAFDRAGIYFPFTDVIVTNPYKDLADGLTVAYYVGQSHVIGGITTDIVAYITNGVFIQAWIGADDKLPRILRAIYMDDKLQQRHILVFSNWKLNPEVAPDAFGTPKAANARHINFSHPAAPSPGAMSPAGAATTQPKQ